MKILLHVVYFASLACLGGNASYGEETPPPLVSRVSGGAYEDLDVILDWILQNPKLARTYPEFKKIVFHKVSEIDTRYLDGTYEKKIIPLKKKALEAAGWYQEWTKSIYQKLHEYGTEFMKSDFSHFPNSLYAVASREPYPLNTYEIHRYLAPLALIQAISSKNEVSLLKGASSQELSKIEKELIATKPEGSGFWFSGRICSSQTEGCWNSTRLNAVKKLFPKVFEVAYGECQKYLANDQMEPVHVSTVTCEKLPEFSNGKTPHHVTKPGEDTSSGGD